MTFAEAMQALQDGKKVRRKCWNGDATIITINDYFGIRPAEVKATDWEIVEEPKPKRTVKMRFYVWHDTIDSWMGGWWEDGSQDPEDYIPTDWVQEVTFEEPEG